MLVVLFEELTAQNVMGNDGFEVNTYKYVNAMVLKYPPYLLNF